MIGIAGVCISHNLRINLRAPRLCVFVFLQHQNSCAFPHYKAASAFVKRGAGRFRVLTGGQRLAVCKSRNPHRIDCRFRPSSNDCVRIPVFNGAKRLSDCMGRGCAGCYNRKIYSLGVKSNRNVSRSDVANHHRNQKRRNMAGSLREKFLTLFADGVDAASSRTDINAQTLRVNVFPRFQSRILHRLHCRRHSVLRKQIGFSHLRLFHIAAGVKIFYLRRHRHLLSA